MIVKIHDFTDSHKKMCSTIKRASLLGWEAGWSSDRSSYRVIARASVDRLCMVDAFYFSGFLCFDEKYILAQISTTKYMPNTIKNISHIVIAGSLGGV